MLGHRPLDQALPRPQLQTLPCTAFTPLQLCESANLVLYAVLEATALISPGNRTEVLKISVVWSGVGSILGELSSASTQTAVPSSTVQAGLGHYFSAVRTCVVQHRRQEKLYTLLLSIISDAASLPARILNSSSYSADHKRPSSFLLELLLYHDFLSEASSNKEFNTKYLPVLTTLVSKLVTPPASLSNMSEILAKIEMVVPGISQPCLTTLSEVWITMAETASKLEVGEKQSSGIESYGTALHLLVFPLSHLHWRGVGKDSRLWKAWDQLYQAVASQAELSVSHTTAHIAHELGEKMVALLGEVDSLTPQQLAVHARCTRAAIDVLDMSSLARSIKPDELLAGFRRIVTPVGSATPLVNHLKALCSHLETLEKEKLEGSTEHLSSAARDLVISIRSLSSV